MCYPGPERLRPERFLERWFGPHEWFPFGGGNRVCPAMLFAPHEMKILLATAGSAGTEPSPEYRPLFLALRQPPRPVGGCQPTPRRPGFRPGLGCHHALFEISSWLGTKWFIEGDISKCFDTLDHDAILSRVPVFRGVIADWLKAGVFTGEVFDPTETGTPQGGVASPLLANIALHGLEDLFHEWSVVGRSRDRMEVVETFSAPPSGYRKCRPENARISLKGPQRPRRTDRREPPKVYGPYPDGSWRTLRLVPNESRVRTNPGLRRDPNLRDLRLIRYADDFVVLARSRRQLERVVLPRLREFLAARGLRLSDEKTRIVRDTEGFDFVGRQFKRLNPTKFLVRPRRRSIRGHRDALLTLFRNRAIPVGHQIQRANAIIRGFCNHFRTDHSGRTFQRLTYWALRSFCKWVARRGGRITAGQAYRRLTRVNGHRFSMPTAYTPEGKLVTLLAHTRFHRLRHQQVKGTNSSLDPRLAEYWEERRERSLLRRLVADGSRLRRYLLRRQRNRCAITGLPIAEVSEVEIHHIIPTHVGGNDDWSNLCLVFPWAHTALHARHQGDYSRASLNDVPFSGI